MECFRASVLQGGERWDVSGATGFSISVTMPHEGQAALHIFLSITAKAIQ